jgi:hypothetical protein
MMADAEDGMILEEPEFMMPLESNTAEGPARRRHAGPACWF